MKKSFKALLCMFLVCSVLSGCSQNVDDGNGGVEGTFEITKSIYDIEQLSSEDMALVTAFEVVEDHLFFSASDGVLFDKEMSELLRYPSGKKDTSYVVPDGVKSIAEDAFYGVENLESIILPDSVTQIKRCAFLNCSSLKEIRLPESLESIDEFAFSGCTSLTSVTIPDGVTDIGNGAFSGDQKLAEIIVDENNQSYCSLDGVLFNKEKTVLISYPTGKKDLSYVVPEGVESIAEDAFSGCDHLKSVIVADSVKEIGARAFLMCYELTDVTLGESLTDIGTAAFYRCPSLKEVKIPSTVTRIEVPAFGYDGDEAFEVYEKIKGFTIEGIPGSVAEKYAEENEFTFRSLSSE